MGLYDQFIGSGSTGGSGSVNLPSLLLSAKENEVSNIGPISAKIMNPFSFSFGGIVGTQWASDNAGNVYIFSNNTTNTIVNLYVYNVNTGTVVQKQSAPSYTRLGSAVYYNGKVYLAAGYNSYTGTTATGSMLIYDINSDTWSSKTISMNKVSYAAVAYKDKIYFMGGATNNTAQTSVNIYDIINDTWTTGAIMPASPWYNYAIPYNDKIYTFGNSASIYVYDTIANTWSTLTGFGTNSITTDTKMTGLVAAEVNGKVYLASSNVTHVNWKCFDLATQTVVTLPTSFSIPYGFVSANSGVQFAYKDSTNNILYYSALEQGSNMIFTIKYDLTNINNVTPILMNNNPLLGPTQNIHYFNNKYYIVGGTNVPHGQTPNISGAFVSSQILEYDPTQNKVSIKTNVMSRYQCRSVLVGDTIYIMNGYDNKNVITNVVESYNITTNTLTIKSPTPINRMSGCAVSYNNKIYVLGGTSTYATNINATALGIDIYDITTDKWTTSSKTVLKATASPALIGNTVYLTGGLNGSGAMDGTMVTYNIDRDSVSVFDSSSTAVARKYHSTVVLNGLIYIIGGLNSSGTSYANIDIYNPNNRTTIYSGKILTSSFSSIVGSAVDDNGMALIIDSENNNLVKQVQFQKLVYSATEPKNLKLVLGDVVVVDETGSYVGVFSAATSTVTVPVLNGYKVYSLLFSKAILFENMV